MKIGIVGNGSWTTALVKIVTDNGHAVNWWIRNAKTIPAIQSRGHNPHYLSSAYLNPNLLHMTGNVVQVIEQSDVVVLAVPSAHLKTLLDDLDKNVLKGKKILSAVKGIVPGPDVLLNEYLQQHFDIELINYFAVLGPCHAEEVAAEKLSYLTFSGVDEAATADLAAYFKSPYINTVINTDILGVQYAAVLKNIYALGAGMAHGLDYGDNFLSVYIANSADEMAGFLKKAGIQHIVVGEHQTNPVTHKRDTNYAASVYLGDLLVTCYSLYSRNRTFGNMIGKGYSVQAAQLELNMVAEGYNASQCMHHINQRIGANMPIAETIYKILWERLQPEEGFAQIEKELV